MCKIKIFLFFLFVFYANSHAQQTIVGSGGTAIGSGGTMSFSIGQTTFTTNVGTTGYVNQGVQQSACISLYIDTDGDGYDNGNVIDCSGTVPPGFSLTTLGIDCNDSNAAINPSATEICYDALDNDCNGIIDDGCPPILTQVQSSQCGANLPTINQTITANLVSVATGYRFKVTKVIGGFPSILPIDIQIIDKPTRTFKLTQLAAYAYNTTYQVEVAIKIGTIWQPFYGTACNVTTPSASTKIRNIQCNTTLSALNNDVFADLVPNVAGYRFRITNSTTLVSQTHESILRVFKMSSLTTPIALYGTTYNVDVALKNYDGTYTSYGVVCSITTPSLPLTQIQSSQCNTFATSGSQVIYANLIPSATKYRFRLTNSSLFYTSTKDNALRTFSLDQFVGLLTNTVYNVDVSVEIAGVFGAYGSVCTLTTPGAFRIENEQNLQDFYAFAYPNPFADNFKIDLISGSKTEIKIRVYDMLGKLLEEKITEKSKLSEYEIGAKYSSGVYSIVVNQDDNFEVIKVIKR